MKLIVYDDFSDNKSLLLMNASDLNHLNLLAPIFKLLNQITFDEQFISEVSFRK